MNIWLMKIYFDDKRYIDPKSQQLFDILKYW